MTNFARSGDFLTLKHHDGDTMVNLITKLNLFSSYSQVRDRQTDGKQCLIAIPYGASIIIAQNRVRVVTWLRQVEIPRNVVYHN